MVTQLGTFLGTELGTDLGAFADGPILFDPSKIYALETSGANYYRTPALGGELGVGTGFGIINAFQLVALSGSAGVLSGNREAASGWEQNFAANNATTSWRMASSTPAFATSPAFTFLGSDVGKIFLSIAIHTGAGNTLRHMLLRGTDVAAAAGISGYTPNAAQPMSVGVSYAGVAASAVSNVRWLGQLAFRGIPSNAQLAEIYDYLRVNYALPSSVNGATATHRTSLRSVLTASALPVSDGQAAPATISDTITLAAGDALGKQGSPVVRVIDPARDGQKTYGALGFTTTSNLQSAPGAGIRGNAAGFTVRLVTSLYSLSGPVYIASCASSTAGVGWSLGRNGTLLRAITGASSATISSLTLTSADLGRPRLMHLVYNGTEVTLYLDATGATPTASAFAPVASFVPMVIGALSEVTSNPAVNESPSYLDGADYVATPADIAADFAAWQRTGVLPSIASKPNFHGYDLHSAVAANGGPPNFPASVPDLAGTDPLTTAGTLYVAQRAERTWSYETTPILQGAEGYTLADYFEAAINALPGDPSGFTVSWLGKITSQAVSSATRRVFGQRAAAAPGWDMGTGGANANFVFGCGGASTPIGSPTSTIAAADVGKLLLFTGVFDAAGGSVRLYAKRVQVGTGSSFAAAAPYVSENVTPQIGRRSSGNAADGVATYGVYYAPGIATLAQVQAQHDDVMANECIRPCPGLPGLLIDLRQDVVANGGALPATLVDRGTLGVNFVRVGAPALSQHYARAWGW